MNLNFAPSPEVLDKVEDALGKYFAQHVALTPGGSSSRKTDLESSDWDFYFHAPGICVTKGMRDELLTHLVQALACKGQLSERGIAIQLQIGQALLELVPRNASYFDWDKVDFPAFLQSSNRSKIDADLREFLSDNSGARVVIRELKAAFEDIQPKVPSFLLEQLVRRMALTSFFHDRWRGFTNKVKLPEAFNLLCHVLEELARFGEAQMDPLSPLQDLLHDLEQAQPQRKTKILEGLDQLSKRAMDVHWVNGFLLHVGFLLNAGRHSCEYFPYTPSTVAPPRSAYSLFMESRAGPDAYNRFLELSESPEPTLMKDRTAEDMEHLQFDPERQKANPPRNCELTDDDYVEYVALCMQFWEISMAWWSLSESERRPWLDFEMWKATEYWGAVLERLNSSQERVNAHPIRHHRSYLHPLRAFRDSSRAIQVYESYSHVEFMRRPTRLYRRRLQRFCHTEFARQPFKLEDLKPFTDSTFSRHLFEQLSQLQQLSRLFKAMKALLSLPDVGQLGCTGSSGNERPQVLARDPDQSEP